MPKRFQPNRRLLTILIGSQLYGSPDACIRELLQNAWDAIQLRKNSGDGQGGKIEIRYSLKENWFEIVDDGIGMDMGAVENSFLEIGEDKLAVLQSGSRETQIGYFGIGILSIFLIADKFEVATKHLDTDKDGLRFEITGIDDEMFILDNNYSTIGTRIRVFLRAESSFDLTSLPVSVRNYARHVDGITITSTDDGTSTQLSHQWLTKAADNVHPLPASKGIRTGRFGMNPALKKPEGPLSSEITICNAGFLAETDAPDLIPLATIGMIGEIDVAPNTLTMGMSRERFQRDERWKALGRLLETNFIRFVLEELQTGHLRSNGSFDSPEIKRNLLLWYHYLPNSDPFSELYSTIKQRVFETVPFPVADRTSSTLKHIFSNISEKRKLFYRAIGRKNERTERIDDEGLPIRVSQEIRDSVRVGALRANGFDVIELGLIHVNIRDGNTVQTHQIPEHELVSKCLHARGLSLINIAEASETDMDLRSIEKLPLLNDALSVGVGLRFASVPDSKRRVITDSSGTKYVNLRNEDVKKILAFIPQAISNPLKNRLLDAYLKLENFQLREARQILVELLMNPNLGLMANARTAPFTEQRIESLIKDLLLELDQ